MSIEEAMMGGIVFKGKKDKPKEENKIKTKAKIFSLLYRHIFDMGIKLIFLFQQITMHILET